MVITPMGECLICNSVYRGCEVSVEEMILEADLIPLDMTDFDAIFGMDLLSFHKASVDCFTKEVEFRRSRYPQLTFMGKRRVLPYCIVSVIEARRMVCRGYTTYLVHG